MNFVVMIPGSFYFFPGSLFGLFISKIMIENAEMYRQYNYNQSTARFKLKIIYYDAKEFKIVG